MKKIIYIVLICFLLNICICFCNPMVVVSEAATTGMIYLAANKKVLEKGEEIEISIHIKEVSTAAYSLTLYFDETKFEWLSGPDNTNVQKNQVKIVWHDSKGGKGAKQGELTKVKLKAKEEGIANFVVDGEFFSSMEQLIQTNFETLQVQIGKEESSLEQQAKEEQGNDTRSSNANLQSMRINEAGIVPDFQSDIYSYDLTITNEIRDIEVLAIAENPNAMVEITGNTRTKRRVKYN